MARGWRVCCRLGFMQVGRSDILLEMQMGRLELQSAKGPCVLGWSSYGGLGRSRCTGWLVSAGVCWQRQSHDVLGGHAD